jgi:hypothetical protein
MAVQGQPLSNLVKVLVSLTATPAQGENIDSMLIMGSSPVIDVVQRMRTYSGSAAVAGDFPTTSPEYIASTLWFGQSPQPPSLNIGRWAQTATPGTLVGAPVPPASQLLSAWTAITNGAFETIIAGVPIAVTGISFAGATNLNGVASLIQAAMLTAGAPAGTTIVWNANQQQFVILLGTTGPSSTIGFLNLPTAIGSALFSANPAAADTLTLNGTAVTFVAALTTGNQILIGTTLANTLANALVFLNASPDVQLTKFNYFSSATGLYFASKITGTPGNAYTLAKVSTAITLSGATLAGGTGADISALLAMQAASSGAYVANGAAAESALNAVILLDQMFSNQWYGLSAITAADADQIAIAEFIESSTVLHYFGVTTQEAGTIVGVDTSNLAYQLKQLNLKKTACQYSSTMPYAAVSYLARILTTNWQGNNTVITEMFKNEPLVVGENMSTTQRKALLANNCNVFINYNNGTTIIEPGKSCSGDWTDTIIAADWFAIQLQTDVYNLFLTSPTKIPQTDAGMHIIATTIEADCIAAVNNGFLAPGVWQSTGFGAISNGSFLPKGYYIYQPLIATQSPAARATRISVPFQIAAKTAGAVHGADISVIINQ